MQSLMMDGTVELQSMGRGANSGGITLGLATLHHVRYFVQKTTLPGNPILAILFSVILFLKSSFLSCPFFGFF